MSPTAQNTAIAEFAGTNNRFHMMKRGLYYRPEECGYTSCRSEAGIYSEEEAKKLAYPHDTPVTMHPAELPDYCTSLDAIAEAESKLTEEQIDDMDDQIHEVSFRDFSVTKDTYARVWRATAAQRAEALLRTIGKWTEDAQ